MTERVAVRSGIKVRRQRWHGEWALDWSLTLVCGCVVGSDRPEGETRPPMGIAHDCPKKGAK